MNTYQSSQDLYLRIFDALALRDLEDAQPDVESDPLYGLAFPEIERAINAHQQEEWLEEQEREWLRTERYDEYWR